MDARNAACAASMYRLVGGVVLGTRHTKVCDAGSFRFFYVKGEKTTSKTYS
jgi:hypothetical protein